MLHITGEKETLSSLKMKEEYTGSLTNYAQQFNQRNPHLSKRVGETDFLPDYAPVFLVSDSSLTASPPTIVKELNSLSLNERRGLRNIQQNEVDFLPIFAAQDILEGIQSKITEFRKMLKDPILQTPWPFWNDILTNQKIPSLAGKTASYSAITVSQSYAFLSLDELSRNMLERYELQLQYEKLRLLKGPRTQATTNAMKGLERGIGERTGNIKQLLHPKIDSYLTNHVNRKLSPDEIRRIRTKSTGAKMARNGKLITTHLDILNKTSLPRLRKLITALETNSAYLSKAATCLNVVTIAQDSVESAFKDGFNGFFRTATSRTTGVVVGTMIGASVTSYLLGAAGTAFLVATPMGWGLIILTGIAVGTMYTKATTECVERVIDIADDGVAHLSTGKFSSVGDVIRYLFEVMGKELMKE